MAKAQRPIINECCLVSRHLKLESLDHEKAQAIVQVIDPIIGVDRVSLDLNPGLPVMPVTA